MRGDSPNYLLKESPIFQSTTLFFLKIYSYLPDKRTT